MSLSPPVEDARAADDAGAGSTPRPRHSKHRRRRVLLIVAGGVVVLVAAGLILWQVFGTGSTTTTTYRTMTVSTQTLKSTVSASGTLQPAQESTLAFGAAGTVTGVEVTAGDSVTKGNVLATLDDSTLQIAYDQAKATLAEARASLADLEDAPDTTDTALDAAQAAVTLDRSQLAAAKADLAAATLKATFSGRVAEVGISKGDTVGSSSGSSSSSVSGGSGTSGTASTSSSSTGVTIISKDTFTVDTSVSNTDVTSIKKGLQATITPTGSADPVFGTVSSVGVVASSGTTSGTTTSGSSTFPVTIKVTGTHTDLLPGSSATVAITTKQLADVIAVPTQAITTSDGKAVVQKLVAGEQVATTVTLGQVLGAETVITKGLADGDQVVVASFQAQRSSGTGTGTQQGDFGGQGGFGGQGAPAGQGGFGGQGAPADQGGTQGGAQGGTR